jgi:flagellar basal-body rod protein FlgG
MQAQQVNIDTIANNIANVNTTGFKQGRAEFQDLLYQNIRPAGTASSSSTQYPVGLQLGLGTRPIATDRIYRQGDFRQTGNPLDLVIEGKGFFQVRLPSGELAYTRDGSFHMNAEGALVTAAGNPLEPQITIPSDAQEVVIGSDGTVSVTQAGQAAAQQVGTIQIAAFSEPGRFKRHGRQLTRRNRCLRHCNRCDAWRKRHGPSEPGLPGTIQCQRRRGNGEHDRPLSEPTK